MEYNLELNDEMAKKIVTLKIHENSTERELSY